MKKIITLILLLSFNVQASECPEGFNPFKINIYNPITNIPELFTCKMENRLEFHRIDEGDIHIITSIYPRGNEQINLEKDKGEEEKGEEEYQFNHYREYYSEDKRKKVIKFTQEGQILREERFTPEGITIYRYLKDAGKLEEFDDKEKIIRKCHENLETGIIIDQDMRQKKIGKIVQKYNIPPAEDSEETEVSNTLSISNINNKKQILYSVDKLESPAGKFVLNSRPFSIEHCFISDEEKILEGTFKIFYHTVVLPKEEAAIDLGKIKEILLTPYDEKSKDFFKNYSLRTWKSKNEKIINNDDILTKESEVEENLNGSDKLANESVEPKEVESKDREIEETDNLPK